MGRPVSKGILGLWGKGMRLKSMIGVFTLAFLAALAGDYVDAGETKTKILKYDAQGKVIGFEETDVKDKDKGKASSTSPDSSKKFNPETSYEEGEIVVMNPPKGFSSDIRSMGYQVIESIKIDRLKMIVHRLRIPTSIKVPKAIRQLRGRFPGLLIDANHQFDPSAGVEFPKKVARALIRWTKAPANCGKGVRIGMIDSGLDLRHPALKGQNIVYKSFHSAGRKEGPKDHGTAVASILVGTPEWGGLLPGAKLVAANMFEINKKGRKVGNISALLKSVSWLFQEKVHIINLSFAGADNKIMRKVFKAVQQQKLVMVAAVGNWGRSDVPAFPAAYKGVIGVTGISDRGLAYAKANSGKYVDFSAPGVRVYTAAPGGGGRLRTGTSFAVPFITALMGLEIAKGKTKTSSALTALLKKNIKDLGKPGRDNVYGWGFARRKPNC
jgi:subtilisin family serine protease